MKRLCLFILGVAALISGCQDHGPELAEYRVARALTISVAQFRAEVTLGEPVPVETRGKIYVVEDMILLSEPGKGIHLIDNSIPSAPRKLGLIELSGNRDMAVRDGLLYADNLTDLLVIDIRNPGEATEVARLENVLLNPVPMPWGEADIIDFPEDPDRIVIGWEIVTELRPVYQAMPDVLFADNMAASEGATGQGGSLARFTIVGDYLYAVDDQLINVFDISSLETPVEQPDVWAGFDIETIYPQGNLLFLGGRAGMSIFRIDQPETPEYVSEFRHGTACDPVVVDGDLAYVTLRGGNACGVAESGLYIVDVSDIQDPSLLTSYPMDEPYGLGYNNSQLYVCDGDSGLKVYDRTDPLDLKLLQTLDYEQAYDVIPLAQQLILIAGNRLLQFSYSGSEGLSVISDYPLSE